MMKCLNVNLLTEGGDYSLDRGVGARTYKGLFHESERPQLQSSQSVAHFHEWGVIWDEYNLLLRQRYRNQQVAIELESDEVELV